MANCGVVPRMPRSTSTLMALFWAWIQALSSACCNLAAALPSPGQPRDERFTHLAHFLGRQGEIRTTGLHDGRLEQVSRSGAGQ